VSPDHPLLASPEFLGCLDLLFITQELNVHLLRGAPLHVAKLPQLSAKATGEPPFMLAAAVACALQDAIGAAWAEHGGVKAQPHDVCPLSLPATTAAIKSALPRIVFSERPTA
jgi:xanthine dehydrogenase molybdopterin-binding subunit B